jgi:predicted AlkP superfamily phosphohydrolase/phosphomutase
VRAWRQPTSSRWAGQQYDLGATAPPCDLRQTKAAALASGMHGCLYLNRHSSGPFAGASEADLAKERAALADRLRGLINPLTDRPLFDAVNELSPPEGQQRYPRLPDLLLVPPTGYRVVTGRAPQEETSPMVLCTAYANTLGTHGIDGLFAARGEGVAEPGWIDRRSLTDVAPTILALAGVPVPADVDGQVIEAVHSGEVERSAAAVPAAEEPAAGSSLSEEDEVSVEERLRSLGYLD